MAVIQALFALSLGACASDGAPGESDASTDLGARKSCGDGICGHHETCNNCPADCGVCGSASSSSSGASSSSSSSGSGGSGGTGGTGGTGGGEIIDAARRIDWTHAGVTGGIPARTTICATLSPGATAAQITNAIAACPAGQVVFLNAGTYNLSDGIDFAGKSDVTLRGAGPDKTFLTFTGSTSCMGMGADICVRNSDLSWAGGPAHQASWTSGYARGATQITLSDTTGLSVGGLLILDQLNDSNTDTGSIWVCSTSGVCSEEGTGGGGRPGREQEQIVKVTAISGSTVTITPGLYMPNWRAAQSPGAWWASTTVARSGVEDMSLDHTAETGKSGIYFFSAYDCWARNVRSLRPDRNHVWLYQSAHVTVRDSYFYGTRNAASQSYGVESYMSSDNLAENNIFQHVTSPIMAGGATTGSVFSYNFMIDMTYSPSPSWMIPSNDTHAAGIDMLLHEGNDGTGLQGDLVHGTHHLLTAFRNRFTGLEPGKTAQTMPINFYAFSRYMNVVGNVLGTQGYHDHYECVPPSGSSYDTSIYALGWSTGSSIGDDLLVATSLLRWGNYDTVTGSAHFDPSEVPSGIGFLANPVPTTTMLPASLYLSGKPTWWGAMPWPAVGPDVTGGPDAGGHAYKVPAHVCYDTSPKNSAGILSFNAKSCYP